MMKEVRQGYSSLNLKKNNAYFQSYIILLPYIDVYGVPVDCGLKVSSNSSRAITYAL